MRNLAILAILLAAVGCEPAPAANGDVSDDEYLDPAEGGGGKEDSGSDTVASVAMSACSTKVVLGLAEQIVQEMNCLRPNALADISGNDNITYGVEVLPYLNPAAAQSLEKAADKLGGIHLNSALRTVVQQYVIYRWYINGRCSITAAAKPGKSNHESGKGIDVHDWSGARSALAAQGWSHPYANDQVHFRYDAAPELDGLDVKAFQILWNRNHPEDKLAVDGIYGTQSAERLKKSPAAGFKTGPEC